MQVLDTTESLTVNCHRLIDDMLSNGRIDNLTHTRLILAAEWIDRAIGINRSSDVITDFAAIIMRWAMEVVGDSGTAICIMDAASDHLYWCGRNDHTINEYDESVDLTALGM